jgi:ELWxxDGT repeat protein
MTVSSSGAVMGNRVFFAADPDGNGEELWVSDGTATGTRALFDLAPGPTASYVYGTTVVGTGVYFAASTPGTASQLYRYDTVTQVTTALTADGDGSVDSGAQALAGRLLFFVNGPLTGREPWVSDGTANGTMPLRDILPGVMGSIGATARHFAVLETSGLAVFAANDGVLGSELWRTDGTAAGTVLLKNINPGAAGSNPRNFLAAGNLVYFSAETDSEGTELWVTDGTAAGTRSLGDLHPGVASGQGFPLGVLDLGPTAPTGPTAGADTLIGTGGADTINGLGGDDSITGLAGPDRLSGSGGDDRISGGAGADRINGGTGNDRLDGGAGNDRLTGDAGADRFVFAGRFGRDVVTDFSLRGDDRIDVSAFDLRFRDLDIRQDGDDAVIRIGRNRITLQDIQADDLTAGDFRL